MRDHLSEQELNRYLSRDMPLDEYLRVSEHVDACETCTKRMGDTTDLISAASAVAALALQDEAGDEQDEHIEYREMESYVDEYPNGSCRELIETHTRECAACRQMVLELQKLKEKLNPQKEFSPKPHPGVIHRLLSHRWTFSVIAVALAVCVITAFLVERFLATGLPKETPFTVSSHQEAERRGRIQIRDEGTIVVWTSGSGVSGLSGVSESVLQLVDEALRTTKFRTGAEQAQLIGKPRILMGPNNSGSEGLMKPVGTMVRSDRPTFQWRELPGTAFYEIGVFDTEYHKVLAGRTQNTSWTSPSPLRRGMTYVWQLRAHDHDQETRMPSPDQPEARFSILSEAASRELVGRMADCRGSHLALAALYANEGLLDEANQEMQKLTELNPQSEVVKALALSLKRIHEGPAE